MKATVIWFAVFGVAAGLAAAVHMLNSAPPSVAIKVSQNGLSSLTANKVEFLQSGGFQVEEALIQKPTGETYFGTTAGIPQSDQAKNTLTLTFPWGKVNTSYKVDGNRLTLKIKTQNLSASDTIVGLRYTPLVLKFPAKVAEYDGSIPLLEHNIGQVAATTVSYGSGTMAIVSEDLSKPLMIGLPWALDKPGNTVFPLSVHTNRVKSYPDSYPLVKRPIPPGQEDEFVVSLRFGRSHATEKSLTGDMDQKFARAFPQQLKWKDRRPIGAIFIATGPQAWATNPRGWFGDPALNVNTPQGQAEFRQRLLALADNAINIMHDMNAQGAITWDIEGQQFRHATTYIGDPRLVEELAPEMGQVVDEYFARFRTAGLRTGVCVRPQLLKYSADKKTADQTIVDDPTDLLIDKIAYAKKRWGASLIYLDSNVNGKDPNPLDASIIKRIGQRFPDCLLIPEHSNLLYYAYSAPFGELRHGVASTPSTMREVYPKAFSAIYTADGALDLYKDGLRSAVKSGDSLMYRTWFADPQNAKVKAIYQ